MEEFMVSQIVNLEPAGRAAAIEFAGDLFQFRPQNPTNSTLCPHNPALDFS